MAQAILKEDVSGCHKVFASEVVRALNAFYEIHVDLELMPDEDIYLTDNIYWGIMTLSFLHRERNHNVFNSLRTGLRNENFFYDCCMLIPTEKNDKFFFNFLKRVSKIYEMAIFCYRNNHNYIETARKCIAEFQDKEYFKYAGSWQRLERIGSFLTQWSRRFREVMVKELPLSLTTTSDVEEICLEEHSEELQSYDKDSEEGLTSDDSFPAEAKRVYNSALELLLADEITDNTELGCIESEIKSLMRYLKEFVPDKILKCYKQLAEDKKNQNDKAESPNPHTSSAMDETSSTKRKTSSKRRKRTGRKRGAGNAKNETANPNSELERLNAESDRLKIEIEKLENEHERLNSKRKAANTEIETANAEIETANAEIETANIEIETATIESETTNTGNETENESPASLLYEHLANEVASTLAEKLALKAKYKELISYIEETKATFQVSLDSSDSKFISDSSKKENKTEYSSILEEDLYLSSSSSDDSEQPSEDKDCNENKIPSGEYPQTSAENDDYIKILEHDLFVEAGKKFKFPLRSHADSEDTEPYSAVNSPADKGDSGAAQENIPSSESKDSLTMNIKPENKSEAKNNNLPLDVSAGPSTASSFTAKEGSDSSSETNNEEQLTPTESAK